MLLVLAASLPVGFASPSSATLGANDYPWPTANYSQVNPRTGFYYRECVDFVAWRVNNDNGFGRSFANSMVGPNGVGGTWGSAYQWKNHAIAIGYTFNTTPARGSVAWWDKGFHHASPRFGHVAYVDTVNLNTDGSVASIVVEEYNIQAPPKDHIYKTPRRIITPTGGYWPSGFIHINDRQDVVFDQLDQSGYRQLARLNGYNHSVTVLEDDAYNADVSPDGRKVAFLSKRGNGWGDTIWVKNLDGSGPRTQLDPAPVGEYSDGSQPRWSPDGTKIAFYRTDYDPPNGPTTYNVYVIDIATRAVTKISTDNLSDGPVSWSPDSKRVVFTANSGGLKIANASGGGLHAVATTGVTGDQEPEWSPDGKRIHYRHGRNLRYYSSSQTPPFNTATASPYTQITANGDFYPRISRDGGRLLFYANGVGLRTINTNGGVITTLPTINNAANPSFVKTT